MLQYLARGVHGKVAPVSGRRSEKREHRGTHGLGNVQQPAVIADGEPTPTQNRGQDVQRELACEDLSWAGQTRSDLLAHVTLLGATYENEGSLESLLEAAREFRIVIAGPSLRSVTGARGQDQSGRRRKQDVRPRPRPGSQQQPRLLRRDRVLQKSEIAIDLASLQRACSHASSREENSRDRVLSDPTGRGGGQQKREELTAQAAVGIENQVEFLLFELGEEIQDSSARFDRMQGVDAWIFVIQRGVKPLGDQMDSG
jgi:hypothetical protein